MSDTANDDEKKLVQLLGDHLLLVRFNWDCGRMGDLDGLFVATRQELDDIDGKHVYFGEVLGKHSEVYGDINLENDFVIVTDDQDFMKKFTEYVGTGTISGYNPFDYIDWDNQDGDEEDE